MTVTWRSNLKLYPPFLPPEAAALMCCGLNIQKTAPEKEKTFSGAIRILT